MGGRRGSRSRDWGGTAREEESLARILDLQGKSDSRRRSEGPGALQSGCWIWQ